MIVRFDFGREGFNLPVECSANFEIRVLIVDDEKMVADSLALVFSGNGYETRTAYSAEQAAEIVSRWEPSLVILDVMLPGLNGIDFAIRLKALFPACHILLFSGDQNTSRLIQEALENGHEFSVMAKPVYPKVFLDEAARLASAVSAPNVRDS